MKKTLSMLVALVITLSMVACGSSDKNTDSASQNSNSNSFTSTTTTTTTAKPTTTTTTTQSTTTKKTNDILDTDTFVDEIEKKISISDKSPKLGSMIGAEDKGTAFKYNGNSFELYRFPDGSSELEKAATGKYSFNIEGFGDFTMNSSVNKNFVLLYETPNDEVIDVFKSIS